MIFCLDVRVDTTRLDGNLFDGVCDEDALMDDVCPLEMEQQAFSLFENTVDTNHPPSDSDVVFPHCPSNAQRDRGMSASRVFLRKNPLKEIQHHKTSFGMRWVSEQGRSDDFMNSA